MTVIALRRLAFLAATCLLVSLAAFLFPYAGGTDPARAILQARGGDLAIDPLAAAALRARLGLDAPLHHQYLAWLRDACRGDLGLSFANKLPVADQLGRALGVSVTLAFAALAAALAVAIPVGTLSAMRPGGRFDAAATFLTQTLVAVPEYWIAPMAILVFSLHLGVLPSAGWHGPASAVLPALVLALRPTAYFTRVTRAAMIDVVGAPYIVAARARGLSMRRAVLRHGVRNGAAPVVALLAMWFAGLLGGSAVVEVIFSIPGMGRLLYQAVVDNDVPMLQGGLICIVVLSVLVATLADLAQRALDPVARVGGVR